MSKYVPKVIELRDPPKFRVLGQYRCTSKGNELPSISSVPCGSLLEITTDNVYQTTRFCGMDCSQENFATFMCPVCKCETDINELPKGMNIYQLPNKKTFLLYQNASASP